jgi:dethiobiotin synthetase
VRRIVVAGTGTGVGKTTVAAALLRQARAAGHPTLGLKPIESGFVESTSDAAELADACGYAAQPLYALREALSPHRAAAMEGVEIDVDAGRRWVLDHEAQRAALVGNDFVSVVELAGGLFTPLSLTTTNLDLLRALEPCCWVLVATDRLGVLHDLGASVAAARAAHRAPDWLVLNAIQPDHATPHNLSDVRSLYPSTPALAFSTRQPEVLWALIR